MVSIFAKHAYCFLHPRTSLGVPHALRRPSLVIPPLLGLRSRRSFSSSGESDAAVSYDHEKDFYSILGVSPLASAENIKKQYYQLALKYHPDHCPNDTSAAETFKLVNNAYDVLKNAKTREKYDIQRYEHINIEKQASRGASGSSAGSRTSPPGTS